jgi:DNA mismatch repair protein MutL
MIDVAEQDEAHSLQALVSPPSLSRANRSFVTIFINRRWVRSRSLAFAVEEAYSGMLQAGRFPIAVVDLRLPPGDVDVNVHPAKAEVRLRNERQVFAQVQRPIRAALSALAPAGAAPATAWPRAPLALTPPSYQFSVPSFSPRALPGPPLQSDLVPERRFEPEVTQTPLPAALPILRPLGQAGTTYVIAEGPSGLYLVDQHAAHERVLYERFLGDAGAAATAAQPLLSPIALDLTPAQASLIATLGDGLEAHGFAVEPFGGTGFLLRSAPAGLRRDDPARAFHELLDLLTREDAPADPRHRVAASLACHAAVRAGQTLAPEEMRDLIEQLEACEAPQTCPHGRPTMLHLSADELARRFARR